MKRLFLWVLLVLGIPILGGEVRYAPEVADPLREPWRWRSLDILADKLVVCSSESPDGSMWFGTETEFYRYDGWELRKLEVEEGLSISLVKDLLVAATDRAYALTVDAILYFDGERWRAIGSVENMNWVGSYLAQARNGDVWIGSRSGLYRARGDVLEAFEKQEFHLSSAAIDASNRLWLGRLGNGQIRVYDFLENGDLDTASVRIAQRAEAGNYSFLYPRSEGGMWALTDRKGLVFYGEDLQVDSSRSHPLKGLMNPVRGFVETPAGDLLFSDRRGLFRLRNGELTKLESADFHGMRMLYRPSILKRTKSGSVLMGGMRSPLYWIDYTEERWSSYPGLIFQCEDGRGDLWFLTRDGSVVRQKRVGGDWIRLDDSDGLIDGPTSILAGKDGTIWVSGSHEGMAAVARWEGDSWRLDRFADMGAFFGYDSDFETGEGTVLFGCGDEISGQEKDVGGMVLYEKTDTGEYGFSRRKWPDAPQRVASIASAFGSHWLGGTKLFRQDIGPAEEVDPLASDSRKWIDSLSVDPAGNLWVAAWGEGLFRFDGKGWRLFTDTDGVRSNGVVNLIGDELGMWVATDEGISRFDGRSWTELALPGALKIDREGGDLKRSSDGSVWVSRADRQWFFRNSSSRSVSNNAEAGDFYTVRHRADRTPPEVWIENADTRAAERSEVHMRWNGRDKWSVTDASLLEFSYRLNGDEWSPFARRKEIVFSDLAAGSHRLEVRVRDQDWNIGTSVAAARILVAPPLWKEPWFWAAALLCALLIATLATLLGRARLRHLREIREFKFWFFTQISHEMRTPLSVILAPIESLLERVTDERSQDDLKMARRNARKMLGLVDQLLEFRKVELGSASLRLTRSDLVNFAKNAFEGQRVLAESRSQLFIFESARETIWAAFDHDKVQKVLDNLISNAIKYTAEGGRVTLRIESGEATPDRARIVVEDTGIGIPADALAHIFKPFYRAKGAGRSFAKGSGIGLALCGELAEAMGATIVARSPIAEVDGAEAGSRFIFELPLQREADEGEVDTDGETESENPAREIERGADGARKTLLVVDDNHDIRTFLKRELGDRYRVVVAENGRAGLELASEVDPDLIVTDVMMPEMDGHAFCKAVKIDPAICHVPVIMLTARRSPEHELDGLETGADDYLSKPIQMRILKARIRNRLETREKLRQKFRRQVQVKPAEVVATSLDERFLAKAIQAVEARISDTEFSVEELAKIMRVPRVTLFRKFKALLGQTPKKFISSLRLKRAAQLFDARNVTVSEVMEQVGFDDPSYFASCFKKEFKRTPSQYIADRAAERGKSGRSRRVG